MRPTGLVMGMILAVLSLLAQDTTFRLDTQLVLVPVVVTDKKGHPVNGLRASDFHIFEDGVEQHLAFFSSETAGSVDDVVALSKSTPAHTGPRHTFVICIDTLHATRASATRTREILEALFEKEKTTDAQYALIAIGRQLQVLQAATTNPLAILVKLRSAAFQNAMGGSDASAVAAQVQNIRTRMDEFCKRCACGTRPGRGNCDSEIDTLKQSIDAESDRWASPTAAMLEQFKSVVAELAKLPTGRTLILVSDGFNIDPKREFYRTVASYLPTSPQFKLPDSANPRIEETLKIASERNVTIDAIDSRGAVTASLASSGSMDASTSGSTGSGNSVIGANRQAAPTTRTASESHAIPIAPEGSAPMEHLARATGGLYFRSGDLLKQFRSALADGRSCYVLAYVPRNHTRDGKFRSITVETADKRLSIRAKSGYWAPQ